MRIKTNWDNYIHEIREKEIEVISNYFIGLNHVLEIGAGDGFQSRIIGEKISGKLIAIEINAHRLKSISHRNVEYIIMDATDIQKKFQINTFDLVYSSNVLEHIPNTEKLLSVIYAILKNDSISIHIMPNPFWTFLRLVLHYPNIIVSFLNKKLEGKIRKSADAKYINTNNPSVNTKSPTSSFLRFVRWPIPHTYLKYNFQEFYGFSKRKWSLLFQNCGFEVVAILKGPLSSGYGFGLNRMRMILQFFGLTSEYIYIIKK